MYFAPGRKDATTANKPGMLPSPEDTPELMAAAATRMGYKLREFVALIGGGHTMADGLVSYFGRRHSA